MKLYHQERLRDDLYKAIDKVLRDHYDRGTFEDFYVTGSQTEIVTNSAMQTVLNLHDYYEELNDGGKINH